MEKPTLENLPKLMVDLMEQVGHLKTLLLNQNTKKHSDEPIGIKEVSRLTGLKVTTLYGYCSEKKIPYHKPKNGKINLFFRDEIIAWIKEGKVKSSDDVQLDVDDFLSSRKSK